MTDSNARSRDLHDELALAGARAEIILGVLAMTMRSDRVPARDKLEQVLERLIDNQETDRFSRRRTLLQNHLEATLESRRGHQRSTEQQWREAAHRLKRTKTLLDPDDPELRRLAIKEALVRCVLPPERDRALSDIRRLLAEAGFPDRRSFQLSIHVMVFATRLRLDTHNMEEAQELIRNEASWRAATYGEDHPFTMVATAHLALQQVLDLEHQHDGGLLSKNARAQAHRVLASLRELHKRRKRVLGERHDATVQTLAYQARVLRILGEHEAARSLALEALALRGAHPATRRDDSLPPVLQIVVADALSQRHANAAKRARYAKVHRHPNAAQTHSLERDRAGALAEEIDGLLTSAREGLDHLLSMERWIVRLRKIQERTTSHAIEDQ